MRREFLKRSAALAAATAVAPLSREAAAQGEPLRVGLLTVRSGALAGGGKQMEDGMSLFFKERKSMLGGRKIELTVADTAGNPAQTKTKTQELVERNKVHVIIGPLAAFEALAIDDYIRQVKIPVIGCAAADDMTQRKANPWFVRSTSSSSHFTHPLADYAAKSLNYKRIVTIADDFAFGHEQVSGFHRVFEEAGGKIIQKLWPPLNVADYGSYISQIKANADAVFAGFAGANGLRFLKQYAEYGLKGKVPVLGGQITVDEGVTLRNAGDEVVGVISCGWYAVGIDSPANKAFVAAVNKEFKYDPGWYPVSTYGAGLILEQALKATGGKVENREAFMKALRGVVVDNDPRGVIRLDQYGNPVLNMYIRKVERRDGKLVNTVLRTIPGVSQFWNYDPKQYLAQPVYSRDNPPAKNLES